LLNVGGGAAARGMQVITSLLWNYSLENLQQIEYDVR